MTTVHLIDKSTDFIVVVGQLLVFGFAVTAYQTTHKRSMLFIGIPCGLWAIMALGHTILPWSWFWWGVYTVATLTSYGLWVAGSGLLFRDYSQMLAPGGEPGAPPHGRPAVPADKSATGEGSKSVS